MVEAKPAGTLEKFQACRFLTLAAEKIRNKKHEIRNQEVKYSFTFSFLISCSLFLISTATDAEYGIQWAKANNRYHQKYAA